MRPMLLYDAESRLCRARAAQWHYLTGNEISFVPYDDSWGMLPAGFGPAPQQSAHTAFHFIDQDQEVYTNGEAAARVLSYAERGGLRLKLYQKVPLFAKYSDAYYRITAQRRQAADRIHWVVSGRDDEPRTYYFTRWMFMRFLGLVYAIAFASLWWQLSGIAGSEGIFPAAEVVKAMEQRITEEGLSGDWRRFLDFPVVFLVNASDNALHLAAGAGLVASVFLMTGILPPLMALLTWGLYLSFFQVIPVFLGYQWDTLLLEAGFLAIFFAPWQVLPGPYKGNAPSLPILWLYRWLAFRLTFMSGAVKLGGPTWENFTALNYHFETQPIPNLIAWYAHHTPEIFLKAGVMTTLFVELIIPFTVFMPRRIRALGAVAMILLQVTIFLSGNYGFFNLLTLAIYVTLFDDPQLRRVIANAAVMRIGPPAFQPKTWLIQPITALMVAVVVVPASIAATQARLWPERSLPAPIQRVSDAAAPFYVANAYGLFARMTTTRPELIVEGSMDNVEWRPYVFRYKPGPIDRRPPWVQPHMPRLDWQLWFEALHAERGQSPQFWFQSFLARVLEGSPPVLGLLKENPFPENPPRYLRVRLEHYTYTTMEHRRETGEWWSSAPLGYYVPSAMLGP